VVNAFGLVDRSCASANQLMERSARCGGDDRQGQAQVARQGQGAGLEEVRATGQQRQQKVLERLRALEHRPTRSSTARTAIRPGAACAALRDLSTTSSARAGHPALANGRRPSAEGSRTSSTSLPRPRLGPGTNGSGAGDTAPEGGQEVHESKTQQIWVAQQEIKAAEVRANARAARSSGHDHHQGGASARPHRQEGDGRGHLRLVISIAKKYTNRDYSSSTCSRGQYRD